MNAEKSTTLEVSPIAEMALRPCDECKTSFIPTSTVNRFCSSPCRQAAYRKSPAHRACLDGLKIQRFNRRMDCYRRKNKFRSLGFDGIYGGPVDVSVPSVGQLDLKRYAKSLDGAL